MTRGFAAIILAAGHARRFGEDKLLQSFKGAPIVAHAVNAACAAPVERVVIVKRPGAELDRQCRAAALADARIALVEIESASLSASLRAGLDAVRDAAGIFIFLGDMPLIPPHMAALLADRLGDHFAAAPRCEGRPGHPVLLSARAAALAAKLSGDHGASVLLRQHAREVAYLETHDDGVVFDVDTIEDLERLSRQESGD